MDFDFLTFGREGNVRPDSVFTFHNRTMFTLGTIIICLLHNKDYLGESLKSVRISNIGYSSFLRLVDFVYTNNGECTELNNE